MPDITSDDIGSFPLPRGIEKEEVERIGWEIIKKNASDEDKEKFYKIVADIMQIKIDSNVKRPTYPQVRDMVESLFKPIESFQVENEPFVTDKKFARIPEVELLDEIAKRYHKKNKKEALELRVCIAGPLELYINKFGNIVEGDLLLNLAKSVSRFVENSLLNTKYIKTKVISIDEPSLGVNSNVQFNEDELIEAFEIAAECAKQKSIDVQIHLHSPVEIELISKVESIGIVGVEYAENPDVLDEISIKELDSHDKLLRMGIARTNIFSMTSGYNEKFSKDVWQDKKFIDMVEKMEPVKKIEKRLKMAWEKFGERIKYAGPDCGLKAWPNQESAFKLLQNTSKAVENFNKSKK